MKIPNCLCIEHEAFALSHAISYIDCKKVISIGFDAFAGCVAISKFNCFDVEEVETGAFSYI